MRLLIFKCCLSVRWQVAMWYRVAFLEWYLFKREFKAYYLKRHYSKMMLSNNFVEIEVNGDKIWYSFNSPWLFVLELLIKTYVILLVLIQENLIEFQLQSVYLIYTWPIILNLAYSKEHIYSLIYYILCLLSLV